MQHRIKLHSISRTSGLQDPEGLLRAPQGGHISRRILQKEVEQNKEMQEELEKLKREKSEELERQREVSAATNNLLKFSEIRCTAHHFGQPSLKGHLKVVKCIEQWFQARHLPETHAQIVEYFLETESGEMQFEAARLRPLLTDDFLSYLSSEIS